MSPANSTLTIRNTNGGAVVVDGNQLDRVFDINPGAATGSSPVLQVTMQGFTIQNGLATDPANPDGGNASGGGVRVQGNAWLSLQHMTVTNNAATADGGGVALENITDIAFVLALLDSTISDNHAGDAGGGLEMDAGQPVYIVDSTISGNTAVNQGGGVWLDAIGTASAGLQMADTVVSHNSAMGGVGGGVGNAGDGGVFLDYSTFAGNSAGTDGGAFGDLNGLGTLFVRYDFMHNNTAQNDGGAVFETGISTQVSQSQLQGNSAGGSGGAIFAGSAMLAVNTSTLAGNTAGVGGGAIELRTLDTGSPIFDVTITGNQAFGGNGGGIDAPSQFTGGVILSNNTINNNFAVNGGGIFWAAAGASSISVANTIIAHNAATGAGPDANNPAGNFTDSGGNLIGVAGAGSGNTGFVAGTTQTGSIANPLDPLLGPLGNNLGPSAGALGSSVVLETELPELHSPAIARGVVAQAPVLDEREFTSVVNGHVNIGAVTQDPFVVAGEGGPFSLPSGPEREPGSLVTVYDGVIGQLWGSFWAFNPDLPTPFGGGVTVAVGDVNGDGISDFILGSGPGQDPLVKVVDGTKIDQLAADGEIADTALLGKFDAYDPGFLNGLTVAYGIGASGVPEIVTGAGPGGGPHVKVIDGTKINQVQPNGEIADSALLGSFYAYSPQFRGGVNVAAGDVDGDGVIDVITGAGPGGGPHVLVIDGTKLNQRAGGGQIAPSAVLDSFFAYDPAFSGGVSVAYGTQIGQPVLVTGAGPGGGPHVKVIDGLRLGNLLPNAEIAPSALLGSFFAYDPSFTGGVHVGDANLNGDIAGDILLAPGPGTPQTLKAVNGTELYDLQPNAEIADSALLLNFFPFGNIFDAGVYVGGR